MVQRADSVQGPGYVSSLQIPRGRERFGIGQWATKWGHVRSLVRSSLYAANPTKLEAYVILRV
jgi:hypothetical protein